MAITANEVLKRARLLLNDLDNVRWTLPELVQWLSDAQREVALHKPNAVTQTVEIELDQGTIQSHSYISLIRVTRNLKTRQGSSVGRTGGKTVTPTTRRTLDAVMSGWQDPDILPYAREVDHIIQDTIEPRSFYVVPGNDGTGVVEAVVSVLPDEIATPNGAGALDIDAYSMTLAVPDIYRSALLDYVLARAHMKDEADPAAAQRATGHMQQFGNALGVKLQSEQLTRIGSTGQTE